MVNSDKFSEWLSKQKWFKTAVSENVPCERCCKVEDRMLETILVFDRRLKAQYELKLDLLRKENQELIDEIIQLRAEAKKSGEGKA